MRPSVFGRGMRCTSARTSFARLLAGSPEGSPAQPLIAAAIRTLLTISASLVATEPPPPPPTSGTSSPLEDRQVLRRHPQQQARDRRRERIAGTDSIEPTTVVLLAREQVVSQLLPVPAPAWPAFREQRLGRVVVAVPEVVVVGVATRDLLVLLGHVLERRAVLARVVEAGAVQRGDRGGVHSEARLRARRPAVDLVVEAAGV